MRQPPALSPRKQSRWCSTCGSWRSSICHRQWWYIFTSPSLCPSHFIYHRLVCCCHSKGQGQTSLQYSALLRGWSTAILYFFVTWICLRPWGGKKEFWLTTLTQDTKFLRHSPQIEGCGPLKPKPQAIRPAFTPLQLARDPSESKFALWVCSTICNFLSGLWFCTFLGHVMHLHHVNFYCTFWHMLYSFIYLFSFLLYYL